MNRDSVAILEYGERSTADDTTLSAALHERLTRFVQILLEWEDRSSRPVESDGSEHEEFDGDNVLTRLEQRPGA
jgi:hypothetical protein